MKKIIQKEVEFCDGCGKETYVQPCLRCGVEHCWECRKIKGIEYNHAVHFQGTGDGYYCESCDRYLKENRMDSLHSAYLVIQILKDEEIKFYSRFKKRVDKAEKDLKNISSSSTAPPA